MRAERVYKTEGVVLKRSDVGEADKIVTLYTPYLGKIRAVAKGVRRPTSKLGGHVELFTQTQVLIARGRNLDIITQAETRCSFIEIRDDLRRLSYAYYLAELVDRFTEEHIENTPLYRLLLAALGALSGGRDLDLELRAFELHLLRLVGYQPQLFHCVACGRAMEPVLNAFSATAGGVFCPGCGLSEPLRREVSLDALKVLRFLQTNDFAAFARLRVSQALNEELEALLGEYIRYLLERNLKSVEFLQTLRRQAILR
jgi:DNA repair protein RecO (recombination protein O)